VIEAGVVGLPDPEWGESVVAAVVIAPGAAVPSEEELREWVRGSLRSSRTPHRIVFLDALPYTDTGKLLRRVLRKDLGEVRA
jgi:acyl-coenzyme A synthetase/AMP-(fatty) acid ligase